MLSGGNSDQFLLEINFIINVHYYDIFIIDNSDGKWIRNMNIILIFFLSNNAKSVRISGGINSVILINDLIKKKIKRHIIHELSSKVALKTSSL